MLRQRTARLAPTQRAPWGSFESKQRVTQARRQSTWVAAAAARAPGLQVPG